MDGAVGEKSSRVQTVVLPWSVPGARGRRHVVPVAPHCTLVAGSLTRGRCGRTLGPDTQDERRGRSDCNFIGAVAPGDTVTRESLSCTVTSSIRLRMSLPGRPGRGVRAPRGRPRQFLGARDSPVDPGTRRSDCPRDVCARSSGPSLTDWSLGTRPSPRVRWTEGGWAERDVLSGPTGRDRCRAYSDEGVTEGGRGKGRRKGQVKSPAGLTGPDRYNLVDPVLGRRPSFPGVDPDLR